MSIHYKFKNALNVDTVTFDGLHISVGDLKKSIIQQKQLGNSSDFDLKITNAQTKEEYVDEGYLIPKNTSLIIARIPLAHSSKKVWEQPFQQNLSKGVPRIEKKVILDLSKMNGSEEEKIQAMMLQSSADYDPKAYQRIRGQTQTGDVPPSYRCNKCKKGGHWIKNCPYLGKEQIEVKRTTGIPKSFREKEETIQTPENTIDLPLTEKNDTVPEDLICSICKDIFTDAVMIPCCGSSFCDDCVRTALLESEDNECPDCKEKGSSPGSLIPNRFLRNSVNTFKNETGYKRVEKRTVAKPLLPPVNTPPSQEENQQNIESAENKETHEDNIAKPVSTTNEKLNDVTETNESQAAATADMESDYEDNIVVTVPPTLREKSSQSYKIKSHDSNSRRLMPPGLEHSMNPGSNSQNYRVHSPKADEIRRDPADLMPLAQNKQIPSHVYNSPIGVHSERPHDILAVPIVPGSRHDVYPRQPYQQMPYQGQAIRGPPIGYNRIAPAPCNSYYPQPPYSHPGYVVPENSNTRPVMPPINLASVYQGVAAKVGSGVIDDPLEAFNRIMREKEREREREHQRSPSRRRSPSLEKVPRSRFSPQLVRRNRLRNSPYDHKDDRIIETKHRERGGYSREREKNSERNRWRDVRKHRRNSRSRSRSIPPSRKPLLPNPPRRRYSRSKSPLSGLRIHQPSNPRMIRRNHDMRNKSPISNHSQRRSHSRSNSGAWPSNQEYEDGNFREYRYRGHAPEIQMRERNKFPEEVQKEAFDISPPGTSEPPPPGFDSSNLDLVDPNQHSMESEGRTMSDIYEKSRSKDFGERKMQRHDPANERSRSKSSKRSAEGIIKPSRSRTVSSERYNRSVCVSPKKAIPSETSERRDKENDEHVVKRRRKSVGEKGCGEGDEYVKCNRETLSFEAEDAVITTRQKSNTHRNSSKESLSEKEEYNFSPKKEKEKDKRFDKKDDKNEKKAKERKKKKKYKEEKERKRERKKRDKQSERESHTTDNVCDDAKTPDKFEISGKSENSDCEEGDKYQHLYKDMLEEDQELSGRQNKSNEDSDGFQQHDNFPELSKWEREDHANPLAYFKEEGIINLVSTSPEIIRDKVTDEVLRKAENAIFSKNSNARHTSIDLTYADRDRFIEKNSKDFAERVQITIPTSSRAQRSIEIMESKQSNLSLTPTSKPTTTIRKSVKDRLGSKVVRKSYEQLDRDTKHSHEERKRGHEKEHYQDRSRDTSRNRSNDYSKGRSRDRLANRNKDSHRSSNNERSINRSESEKQRNRNEKKLEKNHHYHHTNEKVDKSSSGSTNSELDTDDAKQNKKRKHKKEKKRKKRSCSSELPDGTKKRHNKSKKKYKTSKKSKSKL